MHLSILCTPPPPNLLGKGLGLCENLTKVNLPTALRVFNYRVCPAIEAIDWQGGGGIAKATREDIQLERTCPAASPTLVQAVPVCCKWPPEEHSYNSSPPPPVV